MTFFFYGEEFMKLISLNSSNCDSRLVKKLGQTQTNILRLKAMLYSTNLLNFYLAFENLPCTVLK